jgi:hypothetical protein
MIPLSEWTQEELFFHHRLLAELTPFLNAEGVSLNHRLIEEIERRGGLAALENE